MRESASQLSEIFDAALNAQHQCFKHGSFANSRKVGRSQWVDATLAWSLLAGVSKSKVFLGR